MARQDDSSHFALRHGQVSNIVCSLLYDMVRYIIKFANVTVPNLSIFLCQLLSSYNLYYPLLKYIYIFQFLLTPTSSLFADPRQGIVVYERGVPGSLLNTFHPRNQAVNSDKNPLPDFPKLRQNLSLSIYFYLSSFYDG